MTPMTKARRREDLLAPHIPWLQRDELDNVRGEGTR